MSSSRSIRYNIDEGVPVSILFVEPLLSVLDVSLQFGVHPLHSLHGLDALRVFSQRESERLEASSPNAASSLDDVSSASSLCELENRLEFFFQENLTLLAHASPRRASMMRSRVQGHFLSEG